jgi:hypothetical protein
MTTRASLLTGALGALLLLGGTTAFAQDRGQDRPPPRPAPKERGQQDRGQRGQKDTPPKPAKQRDQRGQRDKGDRPPPKPVRDEPAKREGREGRDGRKGRGETDDPKPVRDVPSDRPPVRDEPAKREDAQREGAERDTPPVTYPPLHDTAKKKLQNVARMHGRRLARIEELRAQYKREGANDKLAELDRQIVRQTNLYEGKLAGYERDFGPEQVAKALAELEGEPDTPPKKKQKKDGERDGPKPRDGGRGGR